MQNLPRLAIVVSHPIQHFCPLYRALTQSGELTVRVFFADSSGATPYFDPAFGQIVHWQPDLLDGFEYEVLTQIRDAQGDDTERLNDFQLLPRLEEFAPDVVQIYGFRQKISRDALRWANTNRVPVLYQSDSEVRSILSWRVRIRKRLVVPLLQRRVQGFLTVGDSNEEYYRRYGARHQQLFRTPFPIDEERYDDFWDRRETYRTTIREDLGIGLNDIVLLTVGKLTKLKAIEDAIGALPNIGSKAVGRDSFNVHLLIAGSGDYSEHLKAMATASGNDQRIHFLGFIDAAQLPEYYLAADVLVHTSAVDAHPLAVTEAIASGLPIITSDRVGSIGPTDDIQIGRNGEIYPFGDITALESLIVAFAKDSQMIDSYGRESRLIWQGRRMNVSVQGYLRGVKAVLDRKR